MTRSSSLSGLQPGDHMLHCEVEEGTADPGGGHEFRIISLTRWVRKLLCASIELVDAVVSEQCFRFLPALLVAAQDNVYIDHDRRYMR